MIALISILVLEAAISLCGVIESSQLLCCAIPVSCVTEYYIKEWMLFTQNINNANIEQSSESRDLDQLSEK